MKKKDRGGRVELLLMAAFVAFFCAFVGPDLVREAMSAQVLEDGENVEADRTQPTGQSGMLKSARGGAEKENAGKRDGTEKEIAGGRDGAGNGAGYTGAAKSLEGDKGEAGERASDTGMEPDAVSGDGQDGSSAGGQADVQGDAAVGEQADAQGDAAVGGQADAQDDASAGGQADAQDDAAVDGQADAQGDAAAGGQADARGSERKDPPDDVDEAEGAGAEEQADTQSGAEEQSDLLDVEWADEGKYVEVELADSGEHFVIVPTEEEAGSDEALAWEQKLRWLKAQYGGVFQIPMQQPEEETALYAVKLQDWKQLRGYVLLSEENSGRVKPLAILKTMLENELAGYDGEWSVYIKNLNTGETILINDRPMKSASVMKLFVMGAVYQAIGEGQIKYTDENRLRMNQMITESSNTAANEFLQQLGNGSYERGIAQVNAFIQENGFSEQTIEYNGFDDPATYTDSGHFNQVTAKDCGRMLEEIYRRSWMNRMVSNEIEEMLLAQKTRYKIAEGLPDGVLCGNKTGEMDTTENDAAIIYSDACDYILVVLSDGWSNKNQAISRISRLSQMTYNYLNLAQYEIVEAK